MFKQIRATCPDVFRFVSETSLAIRMPSSATFTFPNLWEISSDLAQLRTLVSSDIRIMK